jgi:uncharacterized protein YprB with RNaseH-like and TPR domain
MAGLADKFSRLAALRPVTARATSVRSPYEEDELARLLGAMIVTNRYGDHVSVRSWFSSPEFAEPADLTLELLSRTRDESLSKRTRAALSDPEKWLFLDTETTGLAGGTGTYAFLVGLAWWDSAGLQTEQLFMRDFGEEHSILQELAERLAERPVLVTFNGKTFDWPLLENRFTMTRVIAKPRLAAHLDLLHPCRALWRLRLGSVRLVELERYVLDVPKLGWHREEDVLSAMIPQHYFDYLRGGPPDPVAAVVRHNQMDLRGLAALVGKIDQVLTSGNGEQELDLDSLDLLGLSRFLNRRGDALRAHTACSQALDLGLPAEFRPQARRELAKLAKRRGDHEGAAILWREVAADATVDPDDAIYACEQLAIYCERKLRDFAQAAQFAQLALTKLRHHHLGKSHDSFLSARGARLEQSLRGRIARVERRIRAANGSRPSLPLAPGPGNVTSGTRADDWLG